MARPDGLYDSVPCLRDDELQWRAEQWLGQTS